MKARSTEAGPPVFVTHNFTTSTYPERSHGSVWDRVCLKVPCTLWSHQHQTKTGSELLCASITAASSIGTYHSCLWTSVGMAKAKMLVGGALASPDIGPEGEGRRACAVLAKPLRPPPKEASRSLADLAWTP